MTAVETRFPVDAQPVTRGPATPGPATRRPVTPGPVTRGPVTRGSVTRGPVTRRGTTRGPVPRWADLAAQATVWCALPAGIWRIMFALGLPAGFTGSQDPQGISYMLPYVLVLSALTEAVAFLSLGLVRPWGEVWPRWVPVLRGRRIRPLAAIIPASLGSIALIFLWTPIVFGFENSDPELPHGAKFVIMQVCYLPLVAWGPLLAAVTVAYAVRRRRHG